MGMVLILVPQCLEDSNPGLETFGSSFAHV